jgi:hypothetical protein
VTREDEAAVAWDSARVERWLSSLRVVAIGTVSL